MTSPYLNIKNNIESYNSFIEEGGQFSLHNTYDDVTYTQCTLIYTFHLNSRKHSFRYAGYDRILGSQPLSLKIFWEIYDISDEKDELLTLWLPLL